MTDTDLAPGLAADVSVTVTDADTAIAFGSGDVPVLATPRIVALVEAAAVAAIAPHLPAGSTSVGTRIELEHIAPSPVGAGVVARATLAAVDGRRLTFSVGAVMAGLEIAGGVHHRVIVRRDGFGT